MKPEFLKTVKETKDKSQADANRTIEELVKQIIFIDSAALALIVAFVSNEAIVRLDIKVLITVAVASFGLSIMCGILEFLNSVALYVRVRDHFDGFLRELPDIPREKQMDHYDQSLEGLTRETSAIPNLLTLFLFGIGLIALAWATLAIIWL